MSGKARNHKKPAGATAKVYWRLYLGPFFCFHSLDGVWPPFSPAVYPSKRGLKTRIKFLFGYHSSLIILYLNSNSRQ